LAFLIFPGRSSPVFEAAQAKILKVRAQGAGRPLWLLLVHGRGVDGCGALGVLNNLLLELLVILVNNGGAGTGSARIPHRVHCIAPATHKAGLLHWFKVLRRISLASVRYDRVSFNLPFRFLHHRQVVQGKGMVAVAFEGIRELLFGGPIFAFPQEIVFNLSPQL